jgi:succinyl-diaminopimelate desuccinylase
MFGRGAVDMKGGIACFVAAVARQIEKNGPPKGSISFLITGDEEGPAVNGTTKLLQWAAERGERWDACLVGEPTNPDQLGDMIKIGRRGSLHLLTARGQGHVAYPTLPTIRSRARRLVERCSTASTKARGFNRPTSSDVDRRRQSTTNVIQPGVAAEHRPEPHGGAYGWIKPPRPAVGRKRAAQELEQLVWRAGRAILTRDTGCRTRSRAIAGRDSPTSGGTSDARFIKNHCPVVEFGLVGQTMHKSDERARGRDRGHGGGLSPR